MLQKTKDYLKAGAIAVSACGAFGNAALADQEIEYIDISGLHSSILDELQNGRPNPLDVHNAPFIAIDYLPAMTCVDFNNSNMIEKDNNETDPFTRVAFHTRYDQADVIPADGSPAFRTDLDGTAETAMALMTGQLENNQTGETIIPSVVAFRSKGNGATGGDQLTNFAIRFPNGDIRLLSTFPSQKPGPNGPVPSDRRAEGPCR